MIRRRWLPGWLGLVWLLSGGALFAGDGPRRSKVDFNREIRPILSDKCFRCHGPDGSHRKADLRLDQADGAADALMPGKPGESEVLARVTSEAPDERMPPPGSDLTVSRREVELLKAWIAEGAEYQPHWSLIAPRSSPLPAVSRSSWVRNPVDHFILSALERDDLRPSPEANPETLLRRVTLDLTGIPPTPAELDAFLADPSPVAYEKAVDRLLQSPRYGERMALDWLDGARYADTNGFYSDAERQSWPWRDWVIRAFNANKRFDDFTIEQLAGDLLPGSTLAQRIATGFNRNHMVTNETGIIDEEYRVGYVVDRVDTTATVWLGMTIGCARCHDHKYDPISQREYYEIFAFFNNIDEQGSVKEASPSNAAPAIALPTDEQDRLLAELQAKQKQCETRLRALKPELDKAQAAWEVAARQSIPEITAAGSVAYFDFDADASDHGPLHVETGTIGTLNRGVGVSGKSATFDATQYVEFDAPSPLERETPFSLATWIQPSGAPSGAVVSKMDATAEARGFEIIWYKRRARINLVHEWGRSAIEIVADQVKSGRWHHLAVTYDGSGKASGLKIFLNGRPSGIVVRRDDLNASIGSSEPWRIAWKGTGVGFEGGIDEFRLYDRVLTGAEVADIYRHDMLGGALTLPPKQRSPQQTEQLRSYFVSTQVSEETNQLSQESAQLRDDIEAARQSIVSSSVMQEMSEPRPSFLLMRGQYDQQGPRVNPAVPAVLGALSPDAPRNRLGLARWLVSPENPLTALVAVNRFWNVAFGDGLVRTQNDFGAQGEQPTHPELLDWLAVQFVQSGWDVKALMRLLVTSATYRQSSTYTPDLLAQDPENRRLARTTRYRLAAELIRDQALAVGGLLAERLGGPSVRPYQPPGVWEAVSYNGDLTYEVDHGAGLYRRGLYTYWKRQAPPTGLSAFDGPTREICTVRRARTNTPTQALVLLNDVTYVEAARGLATRMVRDGGSAPDERVRFGFRCATGRNPRPTEIQALREFQANQLASFRERPASALAFLRIGESAVPDSLDPPTLAAWAATASLILNLDEVITQH